MNNENTIEERISQRINPETTALITTNSSGALAFGNAAQLMDFAKLMSIAQVAIPKHLRGNPGACLAVAIQASEWQMSPFAVANKSYSVNDRLAYEAQLINAVILKRAPIKGRFKISYSGEGQKRKCKVIATLREGEEVEYESPTIGDIKVQNSPLWKSDPDQQLFYFSSRSMCRRHFPDILLGVEAADEIETRDVTPSAATSPLFKDVPEKPIYKSLVNAAENADSPAASNAGQQNESAALFDTPDISPLEAVISWLTTNNVKWSTINETLYTQGVTADLRTTPEECGETELRDILGMKSQLEAVKGVKK